MSGDNHNQADPRERHIMPFPPDGHAHRNGIACPCRPAIHRTSGGVYEFIHQAIRGELSS